MKELDVRRVEQVFLLVEYADLGELSQDLAVRREAGWEPDGSSWMHEGKRRMRYIRETVLSGGIESDEVWGVGK